MSSRCHENVPLYKLPQISHCQGLHETDREPPLRGRVCQYRCLRSQGASDQSVWGVYGRIFSWRFQVDHGRPCTTSAAGVIADLVKSSFGSLRGLWSGCVGNNGDASLHGGYNDTIGGLVQSHREGGDGRANQREGWRGISSQSRSKIPP
jgi:hypothetical protein